MIPFRVQLLNKRVRVVLYRRKAGAPFYAKWHLGKPYHRSTGAFTEPRAREQARKMVEECAAPRMASGLTFAQAVEHYLADRWPARDKGHSTRLDHKQRLKAFCTEAGAIDVGAVDLDRAIHLVQAFIRMRKGMGDSPTSQDNCRRVVSRFFSWLMKTRDERGQTLASWRVNPAAKSNLEIDEAEVTLKPPVPDADIPKLLEVARGSVIWPCVLMCLGAGLRAKETTRQTWTKTNLDTRKMTVKGKRREREILMSDWLHGELSHLPRTGDNLFPYTVNFAHRKLEDLRKAHGLSDATTFQAMRRTACRRAAPKMTPIQYSHYFGHSLEVAKKHYVGYGLMGADANVQALNWSPDKKADKTSEGKDDLSIYEQ